MSLAESAGFSLQQNGLVRFALTPEGAHRERVLKLPNYVLHIEHRGRFSRLACVSRSRNERTTNSAQSPHMIYQVPGTWYIIIRKRENIFRWSMIYMHTSVIRTCRQQTGVVLLCFLCAFACFSFFFFSLS